jgi:hypothetical protein
MTSYLAQSLATQRRLEEREQRDGPGMVRASVMALTAGRRQDAQAVRARYGLSEGASATIRQAEDSTDSGTPRGNIARPLVSAEHARLLRRQIGIESTDDEDEEDEGAEESDIQENTASAVDQAAAIQYSPSEGELSRESSLQRTSRPAVPRSADASSNTRTSANTRAIPSNAHAAAVMQRLFRSRRRCEDTHDEPLPICSLLCSGARFTGQQTLSTHLTPTRERQPPIRLKEQWSVSLEFDAVDMEEGKVFGRMRASNVPNASIPSIATLFEGEILQTLETGKLHATPLTDVYYWQKLAPFRLLDQLPALEAMADCVKLCEDYIFLRIKEVAFGDDKSAESGLTIAGFYYVSMRRRDGKMEGLYYDPQSAPYQKLTLRRDSAAHIHPCLSFR